MGEDREQQLDALFHALSDATRRAILEELAEREDQALFEICVRLVERRKVSATRQAISKHLDVLESAGLIRTRWEGRTKLHSSRFPARSAQLLQWLQQLNR